MKQKRAAVINDICGLGRCSLAAALPVLSILGVQPCAVPTAVLTNQTGYDSYALLDCEPLLRQFPAEWGKRGVTLDAISTGFFASSGQAAAAQKLIEAFRGPDTLLLVDPVLGDHGKIYPVVNEELFAAVKTLVQMADVLTPNATEACLLTGEDWNAFASGGADAQLDTLLRMGTALGADGARTVCITGWHRGDDICTLVFSGQRHSIFANPAVPGSYSGTGDLFSAALCGLLLRGASPEDAVAVTTHFLNAALRAAAEEGAPGADGVPFEPYLTLLLEERHGPDQQ